MARNVGDLALLLSVMAGPDPRAPQALGDPGVVVRAAGRPARWPGCGSRCRSTSAAPSRSTTRSRRWSSGRPAVFEAPGRPSPRRTRRSPRPTTPSARCGPGTSRRGFGALLAEHPDDVQAVAGRQHPGRRAPHRRRRGPRLQPAHRALRADARVLHRPRRAGAADLAGAAVPGRPGVPDRDQRQADGDLPRLDAGLLPDHRHRLPGDLGAGRRAPPTGCRSASRSSPPHGADRFLLEVAAAFEAAVRHDGGRRGAIRPRRHPAVRRGVRPDPRRRARARPRRPAAGRGRPRRRARVRREPWSARRSSLLEEDGKVVRERDRLWRVAPTAEPAAFTDSFHRMLGGRARPVRRLLVGIEDGSHWSHELLRAETQVPGVGDRLRLRRRAARLDAGDDGPRRGAARADRRAGSPRSTTSRSGRRCSRRSAPSAGPG